MAKTKFKRELALGVARELCDWLGPVCDRLEVAGSLRRGKPEVGDVELLFVPAYNQVPKPGLQHELFGEPATDQTLLIDCAEKTIERMVLEGVLAKRPNKDGRTTWGPENKLALHVASGVPVDLFKTDGVRWWTALVIRTGGKDTNKALAAGAIRLGRKLHAYGFGVTTSEGIEVRADSEEHLFELCGLPYLEPEARP